jgi:hypothetical protein
MTAPRPAPDARPFAGLRAALAASTQGTWLAGQAGNCNLVAYDGYDIVGIARVSDRNLRWITLARNQLPDVLARLDAAEAELRRLEWVDEYDEGYRTCPVCSGIHEDDDGSSHKPGCTLAAALAPASPAPEAPADA